jgi:glycosyltransferase involved in cell wall biosynthesis
LKVGVFATNIRAGGGVTHLSELLNHWTPQMGAADGITVWTGPELAARVTPKEGMTVLDCSGGAFGGVRKWLPRRARECDLVFVPGGTYLGRSVPFVAMSQNMLVFSRSERARYQEWSAVARLRLLNAVQRHTLARAAGIIYLSETAKTVIGAALPESAKPSTVIPHGIQPRFFATKPRAHRPGAPLRVLYVSAVAPYKHQWHVIDAIAELNRSGLSLELELVGAAYPPSLRRLTVAADAHDPGRRWLSYRGDVSHETIHELYHRADIFVFASSCENLPNILIEAMAAGLPIAASRIQPMPEVLGDGGLYFDPTDAMDIARCVRTLATDARLRASLAQVAFERATRYSWERCARETFTFLEAVARDRKGSRAA